jgi:branched-chain amino acid transport system ATP-binding protein
VLEINALDVFYADLQALWEVSLNIGEAEIVTLVGSNGAGKSTILKTISGLLKPRTGTITYNGIRLDKLAMHKIVDLGIGMVPEGRRLFPQMTVLENLEMGSFIPRARPAKNATLGWVYEIFPVLKERTKQVAGTLSGGQQQMLAIGRALMSQPRLLLLDEMSLGLAPLLVQNFSRVIKQINKEQKISIFLVEQNVNMALSLADRGYIMENGRIIFQGDAKTLLNNDLVKDAYLGIKISKPDGKREGGNI